MQQPSAQGIASLYMGNPGPLQNRVKQEQQQAQQGKIAPDLQRLMDALGIVETVQQGSQRQNAMNQMQQMGGPNPPTVAQSLEQRAHQALQARMVQEMQKQQAMQGQQGIPQGVPQPQRQPQGIDNLPVEFQMAGGGIVAFNGTEGSTIPKGEGTMPQERQRSTEDWAEAVKGSKDADPLGLGAAVRYIREALNDPNLQWNMRKEKERQAQAEAAAKETPYEEATATRRSEYAPEERPPVADLKALATQAAPRPAPMPAPSPAAQGLGAAAQALRAGDNAVPGGTSDSRQTMLDALALNPDARSALITDKYKSAVPAPDFTQRNAAIEALKAERERYQNKQPGWDSLMEYLGQVAATPRGLRSFEAGAMGARNLRAQEEANAQKRYDLGMKIIEQEQGKIDAMQNYAKDVYGVGKSEYDNIYKTKLEVAKTLTTDEREARKLAAEMAMKEMEMKQRVALHATPSGDYLAKQAETNRLVKQYQADNPGASEIAARTALGLISVPASMARGQLTYDQASDNVDKYLSSMAGIQYMANLQKEAKQSGKPVNPMDVRSQLIRRAMEESGSSYAGKMPSDTGGSYTVSVGGKSFTFPSQEAANKFKAEAGVK